MALVPHTGRELYNGNAHLRRVSDFMENPDTRELYKQYFGQYEDLVCFTMFLKLYEEVEKNSTVTLTPYQKVAAVRQIIDNGSSRQMSVAAIRKWFHTDNRNRIQ